MRHSLLGYVHGRLELPATERLKLAQNKTPAKVRFGDFPLIPSHKKTATPSEAAVSKSLNSSKPKSYAFGATLQFIHWMNCGRFATFSLCRLACRGLLCVLQFLQTYRGDREDSKAWRGGLYRGV